MKNKMRETYDAYDTYDKRLQMVRDTVSLYQDVGRRGGYKANDRNFNVNYDPQNPADQKKI